ncbi:hypothetical protein ApDm4_2073 [Acetobacter pomorum]|nr:hypothetical protein ApDm4_2073 [Acetobacter pomorum]
MLPDNQRHRTIPSSTKTIESPFFSGIAENFLYQALKFLPLGLFLCSQPPFICSLQQDYAPKQNSHCAVHPGFCLGRICFT